MACRNIKSETNDRRPKEKGRTTSAGKAGMSNPVSSAVGARRSARARERAQQAASAASARSGAAERIRADAFTCVGPMVAMAPSEKGGGAAFAAAPPYLRSSRSTCLHVVVVVRRFSAGDVAGLHAGGGGRRGEGARPGGDRPVVEVRVAVHVADREHRPLRSADRVVPGVGVRDAGAGARALLVTDHGVALELIDTDAVGAGRVGLHRRQAAR